MISKSVWFAVSLACGTVFAGCASGGSTPAGDVAAADGQSVVIVQNDHGSRREVLVYLEPEGRGERQNLGSVAPGETGTFTVDIPRGFYRLIAGHDTDDLRSDRFNVGAPSTIRWSLGAGRLQVSRR